MLFRSTQAATHVEKRLFHPLMLERRRRLENEAVIRGLCSTVRIDAETTLARALGRYKIYLDTHDVGLSVHLMLDGYWEMWLTEALASVLKPGMVVADVGANVGYFTLLMADMVGPKGQVHAFEPYAPIAARLRLSASANGYQKHVRVHETLLGEAEGQPFRLVVPDRDPKNSYMVPASDSIDEGEAGILRTRRLDSFRELDAVSVLKIDADTAEQQIWRGMRGIFDRGRPLTIFLEFNDARYSEPQAFLEEIAAEGFRISRVDIHNGIEATTIDEILTFSPAEDQILMLVR